MTLVYTEEELLLDHPDLTPHVVAGRRMHGGFTPDGLYQPPSRAGPRSGTRRLADRTAGARRQPARGRCVAARRRPPPHGRAVAGAAASRARRDVLELAHHHGQDRGAGSVCWRTSRSRRCSRTSSRTSPRWRSATSHKGLLKAHGWDEGGVAAEPGTRHRRPRPDVVRRPRSRVRRERLPRRRAAGEHRPAGGGHAVHARDRRPRSRGCCRC